MDGKPRLGVTLDDVRLWELDTLDRYLKALDLEIHVQALGRDAIFTLY